MDFNIREIEEDCLNLKGDYIITDPCYVIPDEVWDKFCEQLFVHEPVNEIPFLFDYNGQTCVLGSTKYGDGSYDVDADMPVKPIDGHDKTVGVDAGLIAFFPKTCFPDGIPNILGVEVQIDGVFIYDDGNFSVTGKQNLSIITGQNPDEDEEDEDDYDQDDDDEDA